ncbi:hypothetical protein PIIN_10882 [Serendipita indica DSM 11827]|uniref:Uncharacterized protein n=1 Tax=Serendipita indica (strain DSM 11827) TaxID=1109443 RepID=G4U003_SERID|nr:hypothetical protein PIIN_10882 [Serendipita indica DSM 11827]
MVTLLGGYADSGVTGGVKSPEGDDEMDTSAQVSSSLGSPCATGETSKAFLAQKVEECSKVST